MQKSPFYLLFSPDTKNEFSGNIKAPSLRLLRTPVAFSPSPRTRGLFAITAHQWPFRHHHPPVATAPSPSRQFQASNTAYHPHSDGEAPSRQFPASNTAYHPHSDGEAPSLRLLRTPVTSSPSSHTSSLFALTAHPWRRRPRRRGRSKLPTRHIIRTATARRRRYVCSAHPWPLRPHHPPVATAPSPSRPFPASNTAYHPHSDGEAPSLRLLRTPMAFFALIAHQWRRRGAVATFAPHTRSLFAIIIHQWPFRPHRTPVATAPSPSRPFPAHSNSNLDLIVNSVIPPTCDCVISVNIVQLIAKLFL